MRRIMVFRNVWTDNRYELKEVGEALFYCFSLGHDEGGPITIAIVEWDNGTVTSESLEHIRFLHNE